MDKTIICTTQSQTVVITKNIVAMVEPFNILIYDNENDKMYAIMTDMNIIKIMPITNDVLIIAHLDYIKQALNKHDIRCEEALGESMIIQSIVQNIEELINNLKLIMITPIRSTS